MGTTRKVPSFSFGGVSSRDNPANYPINRSVRCRNFRILRNNSLRLRDGYTQPTMSTVSASTIHTAAYFELYAGTRNIVFSQGSSLKQMALSGGAVTSIATLSVSTRWNCFRANNKLHLGNGTDFKMWDGATLRNNGIRAPAAGDFTSASTNGSVTTATQETIVGGITWSTVSNVLLSDNNRASVTMLGLQASNWIHVTGLGLSIPASGSILGVSVIAEGHSGGTTVSLLGQLLVGDIRDGTQLSMSMTASADANHTLGGATQTWGVSLTPAILNSSGFGAAIAITTSLDGATVVIDQVTFIIAYTAGATISATTATAGSFSTTTLTGYQLYMSYYNPNTGHVGNRLAIGSRVTVAGSGYSLVASGLPDLSSIDTEWVKVIGRTPDGGEVPYWFIDSNGNLITVGNAATVATITLPDVDYASELPTRNSVGSGFVAFTRVGGRIFGIKANDVNFYYSEAEEDAVSGDFVGRPEESWPANNAEACPVNEVPTAIHGRKMQGWFFTANHLLIWSESLRQQITDPWQAVYVGGCAGQRAFCWTPYGPYWLNAEKQLMTWGDGGPVVISDEYEDTLLSQISDANLATAEITWFRDPALKLDYLKVLGQASDNSPVVVLHDFNLRDERSPFGQGYDYTYANTLTTFVGSGYTPFVAVRDSNKKMRSWAGASNGRFFQLDDGVTDNGSTFQGDYISGPVFMGYGEPRIAAFEYLGDPNLQVDYSVALDDELTDFVPMTFSPRDESNLRYSSNVSDQGAYFRARLRLTSTTNGSYSIGSPAYVPVNDYGIVYGVNLKLGAEVYGEPQPPNR